jgi:putative transcriptional regulator
MAELSRRTGITKNALSDMYYGKAKSVHYETLEKICAALGCTIGELIEYQLDTNKPASNE